VTGPERVPSPVTVIVVPVAAAGAAVVAAAIWSLSQAAWSTQCVVGALILLAAATIAEAFPVPVDGFSGSGVSLAASFLVGTALICDWETAALLGAATRGSIEIAQRRPPERIAFNSATYALAAAAAGGVIHQIDSAGADTMLVVAVAAGSFAFYAVNISLVALVVARASGVGFGDLVIHALRWTSIPFAIMASVSLILDVLWMRSPYMAVSLVGPLVAVALYQRSVHGRLEALRLANTDPVTSLGNHRAFQERMAELTHDAEPEAFSLYLLDIDGFKQLNDRYGHQMGDGVLARVAGQLPACGEAFRLGGDEFAVLVHDPPDQGVQAADRLRRAIAGDTYDVPASVTVSIGIGAFPHDGRDVDAIVSHADTALYRAKHQGKNRVATYADGNVDADVIAFPVPPQVRAVWQLTEIVDAADRGDPTELRPGHPTRVADLSTRVAIRMGLEQETVELIQLAARLHDVGKLIVPGEILSKTGPLTDIEWTILREHVESGTRILEALGAGSVAEWVRHHHERWDGTGYPEGLAGVHIPIASRIIFVADAYDAMTSDRPYRAAMTSEAALAELETCAGTQFDPHAVRALVAEVTGVPSAAAVA